MEAQLRNVMINRYGLDKYLIRKIEDDKARMEEADHHAKFEPVLCQLTDTLKIKFRGRRKKLVRTFFYPNQYTLAHLRYALDNFKRHGGNWNTGDYDDEHGYVLFSEKQMVGGLYSDGSDFLSEGIQIFALCSV